MKTVYCTTFCNRGHWVETGWPTDHECYVLPPAMLEAERAGDMKKAQEILDKEGKGPLVFGRKLP